VLAMSDDRPASVADIVVEELRSRQQVDQQMVAGVAVCRVLQPGFETLGWAYSGGQL
jgi:hypothetical protein